MKKVIHTLIAAGVLIGVTCSMANAENIQNDSITVKVDNNVVSFPDATPYIDSNRVLVPIRFVAEQLGSAVEWNESTQTVDMVKGSKTIELVIGHNEAKVNGVTKTFDTKASIQNNRTFVPLRFISETFGSKVDWDTTTRTVSIKQPTVADRNQMYAAAPTMQIDPSKSYVADIKTNKGSFKIQLDAKDAPITVNNFVFLAKDGYYDGITFHRILKDFVIQTGDPLGNGTGGPGYEIPDELSTKTPYEKGIVAMANAGPNTGGSQFFICTGAESENLNQYPNYTIFGRIIDGMDVVTKIAETPVGTSSFGEPSKPMEDVNIESITIN